MRMQILRSVTLLTGILLTSPQFAWTAATPSQLRSRIAALSIAIKRTPSDHAAIHERGQRWASLGQYELALQDFDLAIRYKGTVAEYYAHRAAILHRLDKTGKALTDCQLAIDRDAKCWEAYRNFGHILLERGDFDGALVKLEAAVRINPDDARSWRLRGHVWLKRARKAEEDQEGKESKVAEGTESTEEGNTKQPSENTPRGGMPGRNGWRMQWRISKKRLPAIARRPAGTILDMFAIKWEMNGRREWRL